MGRQNFDRMAERLQLRLQPEPLAPDREAAADLPPAEPDFDI